MGIFNKLFGGADGIRESVNEVYEKQFNIYKKQGNDLGSSHRMAIISALGIRYAARFKPQSETFLTVEAMPFFIIENKKDAANILAEYIVFKETPNVCNYNWLKEKINSSLNESPKHGVAGIEAEMPWKDLLEQKTIRKIKDLTE